LVAEQEGDLMAVCSRFLWPYRVGEKVLEIWTAADFRAERRAAVSSVTGLGWRALRKRLEGKPALISLVKDNPLSFRLFSKGRRGWPCLHEVARLKTVMLPLATVPSFRSALGLLPPSRVQVCQFLNEDKSYLAPVFEPNDIGRVTPGLESFLAYHDGVNLGACGALWDPSDYRQIRIAGYNGLYARLKRWCSPLLPDQGSEVRIRFAAFLKGDCRVARSRVFQGLVTRAKEEGAQFLVWGGGASEAHPFPGHWPFFKMESSLYQLCWDDERLPRALSHCGFEVAWL
jgi:hypothetical protein